MLLFKKEKQVVELILKHLDMVEDCLMNAIKTIEYYTDLQKKAVDSIERIIPADKKAEARKNLELCLF